MDATRQLQLCAHRISIFVEKRDMDTAWTTHAVNKPLLYSSKLSGITEVDAGWELD
jgi:hypothetical protein